MASIFHILNFMDDYPLLYDYFEILVGWETEKANISILKKKVIACDSLALARLIKIDCKIVKESFASEKRIRLINQLKENPKSKEGKKAYAALEKIHKAELGFPLLPGVESKVPKPQEEVEAALLILLTYEITKVKSKTVSSAEPTLFERDDLFKKIIINAAKRIMEEEDPTLPSNESLEEVEEYLKVNINNKQPVEIALQVLATTYEIKIATLMKRICKGLRKELRKATSCAEIEAIIRKRNLSEPYEKLKTDNLGGIRACNSIKKLATSLTNKGGIVKDLPDSKRSSGVNA